MKQTSVLVVIAGAALSTAAMAGDTSDRAYQAELLAASQSRANSAGMFADAGSTVAVHGFSQFRWIHNFRDNPSGGSSGHDSGYTHGFEATRTRLEITGTIGNDNLSFKIDSDFDKSGEASLQDAYGNYKLDDNNALKWGQFKLPMLREELVSDVRQLSVDRSVVNTIFTAGRAQGLMWTYESDSIRFMGAVSDGPNTRNTPYNSASEGDLALTGRFEMKWGDDWKRFNDFTSWQNKEMAGLFGAAFHWQHVGNTAAVASQPQFNMLQYTLDYSLEGNGWNFYLAGVGNHTDPDENGTKSTDDWGVLMHGGIFVSASDELFARWDWVIPDGDRTGDDDFHTLAVGWNHYFFPESHAAKFTADVQWFVNEPDQNDLTAGIMDSNNNALRTDSESDQIALRLQMTLVF
ncbi:MAG: porin [Phycisphaerales bacterium]